MPGHVKCSQSTELRISPPFVTLIQAIASKITVRQDVAMHQHSRCHVDDVESHNTACANVLSVFVVLIAKGIKAYHDC
jgi:hypothetical protein